MGTLLATTLDVIQVIQVIQEYNVSIDESW